MSIVGAHCDFSSDIVLYKRDYVSPYYYEHYVRLNDPTIGFVSPFFNNTLDTNTFTLPEGSIVAIGWYTLLFTQVFTYDSTVRPFTPPFYSPTYYNLRELKITGSNGSLKMTLLTATATASPNNLELKCFNQDSEIVETFNFPAPECFKDISRPIDQIIKTSCSGYTQKVFRHDGEGGINIETTANSVACGYVAPLSPFVFTKDTLVRVKQVCKNPLMLKWKNRLGGWDSWVFEKRQIKSTSTQSIGTYTTPFFDIEDTLNPNNEIGKIASSNVQLGADDLTADDKIAISEIILSNKVYAYNKESNTFYPVIIKTGSFLITDNGDLSHSIELEYTLPPINTITN